jgi:hypothetical protein
MGPLTYAAGSWRRRGAGGRGERAVRGFPVRWWVSSPRPAEGARGQTGAARCRQFPGVQRPGSPPESFWGGPLIQAGGSTGRPGPLT